MIGDYFFFNPDNDCNHLTSVFCLQALKLGEFVDSHCVEGEPELEKLRQIHLSQLQLSEVGCPTFKNYQNERENECVFPSYV